MFVLKSEITIGNFRFSGVNDVVIKRGLHSIVETARIKIPSRARIVKAGKEMPESITTANQINVGDPVTIKLGYGTGQNNRNVIDTLQTEFTGFVKAMNVNLPLEVVCEGYSRLLRKNTIVNFWKSITLKDLLTVATDGIDPRYKINVQAETDFELNNVEANNITGLELLSNIAKYTEGSLTYFFKQPGVLWCGFVYADYAKGKDVLGKGNQTTLKYRLGYNTNNETGLRVRMAINEPVVVKYNKRLATGEVIAESSDVYKNATRIHNRMLNNVANQQTLKNLANEKAYQLNYTGYEGFITVFLQPNANVGDSVYIEDRHYPKRNGVYLVEATEVLFGINGARRILELGPKLGFAI